MGMVDGGKDRVELSPRYHGVLDIAIETNAGRHDGHISRVRPESWP